MTSIKPIDKNTIARICSGQVIADLAAAVKELVENSIDAGATHVEIKLHEYGSDLIEVSDNGDGLPVEDYDGFAMKYHTSKLKDFNDLKSVSSFGFRGEAISSLCELSGSFTVITKTANEVVGTKLSYDRSGNLICKEQVPKTQGTTVSIRHLFSPLPVRRTSFKNNIKKQYNRLVQILNGYAVISVGIRMTVTNTVQNKGQVRVLSTQKNYRIEDNISCVFGAKFLSELIPLTVQVPEIDMEVDGAVTLPKRSITGMISKAGEGIGRCDNDRQYTFVNGRPVELPKICRVINEVWRQYDMKNKPAVILDLKLPPGTFDVNVTPDKREVFITEEVVIIDALKLHLHELWSHSRSTFTLNQAQHQTSLNEYMIPPTQYQVEKVILPARIGTPNSHFGPEKRIKIEQTTYSELQQGDILESTPPTKEPITGTSSYLGENCELRSRLRGSDDGLASEQEIAFTPVADTVRDVNGSCPVTDIPSKAPAFTTGFKKSQVKVTTPLILADQFSPDINLKTENFDCDTGNINQPKSNSLGIKTLFPFQCSQSETDTITPAKVKRSNPHLYKGNSNLEKSASKFQVEKREKIWDFDPIQVLRRASSLSKNKNSKISIPTGPSRAELGPETGTGENNAKKAAEALSRVLCRDDFSNMKVIGQFNLGFVIALLGSDLFILDQHACDEKRNFERLQRDTILRHQPLMVPKILETTANQESVIMDNLSVFERNGFGLEIDECKAVGTRIRLTAVAYSRGVQLDSKDVLELVSILTDNHGSADGVRLPKIQAMYAMRACRSSIMVGTALDLNQMKRLVQGLSMVEHPWNCPHGRPTLRHLVDMSSFFRKT